MCEYCYNSINHHTQCPYCPEPPIVYHCDECSEPIYVGDDYYRISEDKYCVQCMDDMKCTAEVNVWEED